MAVTAIAEVAFRRDIDAKVLVLSEIAFGTTTLGLLAVVRPSDWNRFVTAISDRLFFEGAIAETQNLLGPSFGWLLLFGFVLVLAVPYLAWATPRVLNDARWAAPVTYGWYLTILATVQIRFVGELATFAALYAGLGFVHLAERVDVARRPVPFARDVDGRSISFPEPRQIGVLVVLFLLVGGLGVVQVPVKTNQLTTPDELYETATWMSDYSDDQGWTYPNNYVFSEWSRNRVYNYFVSGESRSYRYAKLRYESFLTSSEPTAWYEQLRDRTGFIVYTGRSAPPESVGKQLQAYGSRTENVSGLGHYRAVHVSDTEEYRVFTLVPGATISGSAEPNTTLTVTTNVAIDGATFVYEREVATNDTGNYSVTVPYPGTYSVGEHQTSVSEDDVTSGGNVTV